MVSKDVSQMLIDILTVLLIVVFSLYIIGQLYNIDNYTFTTNRSNYHNKTNTKTNRDKENNGDK